MSDSTTKRYWVFGDQAYRTMVGDREEEHREHEMSGDGCDWWAGPFATASEAMEAGHEWLEGEPPATKHDQRTGIGYITWSEFTISEEELDEDGDFVSTNFSDGASNLTKDVETAFEQAKRSYYSYLDFEVDEYLGVLDF